MFRKLLLACGIVIIILAPTIATAADFFPIVPCGRSDQTDLANQPCRPCHLVQGFKNVIDLVLFGVTGPIAVFLIIVAGGMILLGAGNPKMLIQGKTLISNTLLGVTVILLSWIATTFLIKSIAPVGGQGDSWYQYTCPQFLVDVQVETMTVSLDAPPVVYVPATRPAAASALSKAETLYARVNLCLGVGEITENGEPIVCGPCPQYAAEISQYANSIATAPLIEAIMYAENKCNVHGASGKGAYGLMQLQVPTAKLYSPGCLNPAYNEPITPGWLQDPKHAKESICIAAKFIQSLASACGNNPRNLAAGYNAGDNPCGRSSDCDASMKSCTDGQPMRRWECPWNDPAHQTENTGFIETINYAPKVAACAARGNR